MEKPSPKPGSAGDIALPDKAEHKGRANRPGEPPLRNDGSAGGISLPDEAEHKGGANRPGEPLPQRKKLPHEIPSWVKQGERHFITINCTHRGGDQLLQYAPDLLKSARHYEDIGRWYMWLILIMPDHIHFIATFDLSHGIKKPIAA